MKDRVALLSQDAASDEQFAGVDSIVSQGVRSTICAPLVADTRVHGALYADRLDPFAAFKPDDLELISAGCCADRHRC
jgi:3',5'-cyclic-nucleotide phosphodiesterase